MKKIIIISAVLLFVFGCSSNSKEYPNVVNEQLVSQIKWGMNYSTVKNILTKEYMLEYSREIEQGEKNKTGKVYEFLGGKYNSIVTHSWVLTFEKDSLTFIVIKIAKENPSVNENIFSKLTEINNNELVTDTTNIPNERRWSLQKGGTNISDVSISMMPNKKGIAVLLSKPFNK